MDVKATAKEIIGKKVNVDKLSENDDLLKLGLDSLDLVEIMLDIEDAFKVEFSSEELAELKTVKQVLDLIESKKH